MEKKVLTPEELVKADKLETCMKLCKSTNQAGEYRFRTDDDGAIEICHIESSAFFMPTPFANIADACGLCRFYRIANWDGEDKVTLRIF